MKNEQIKGRGRRSALEMIRDILKTIHKHNDKGIAPSKLFYITNVSPQAKSYYTNLLKDNNLMLKTPFGRQSLIKITKEGEDFLGEVNKVLEEEEKLKKKLLKGGDD